MNESIWDAVLDAAASEFSDLSDVEDVTRLVIRLTTAMVLGGILGFEREHVGRSAGLRTHMLLAVGAALFVYVPIEYGFDPDQLSRVLQGLVSGVGFLGAGAILKLSQQREIRGLTTAGSLWTTAAIGVAAGMGLEVTAIFSTALALVILGFIRRFKNDAN